MSTGLVDAAERVRRDREAVSKGELEDMDAVPTQVTDKVRAAEEEREQYLRQIQRLRDSIAGLEAQLEDAASGDGDSGVEASEEIVRHLLADSAASYKAVMETDQSAEEQAESLGAVLDPVAVSGISFSRVSSLRLAGSRPLREHTVTGACHALGFTLVFTVDETLLQLTALNISADESVARELAPLIAMSEERLSPRTFFRGFVPYAEATAERGEVFASIRGEYSSRIHLEGGLVGNPVLVLTDLADAPRLPFTFAFEWAMDFDASGDLVQRARLHPIFSKEYAEADTENTVSSMTGHFENLIEFKGVRTALNIMIKLALGEEAD